MRTATGLAGAGLLAALALAPARVHPPAPDYDVLLVGGTVVDGTGAPRLRADVALTGDRIAAIGDLAGRTARRTVDVSGLVVAPGFIDMLG
ncbi:MAG: hypothetical protein ACHP93_06365, partial [Solirubrobacterales bacterium]